jgi:aminoglycoside phosphotransferase (APT) family kinase protein
MSFSDLIPQEAVGRVLAGATGDEQWLAFDAKLIAGGKSNLTFELASSAGSLILRRPPTGILLPSAHDMVREVRIQRALAPTQVPVPKIVLLEATGDVIGVPFYVMKKVEGYIIRDTLPPGFAESVADKEALAGSLIDALAELHAIDPSAVGLTDFGRPENFLARQIRRWSDQWELTKTFEVPALSELALRLIRRVPRAQRTSIVHGDYRLDNSVYSHTDPGQIEAILDWELSSLGDPLVDLGLSRFYWRTAGERTIALVPQPMSAPNFPTRDFLAERYAVSTGLDLSELAFYDAFARFKFAVITQGVLVRSDLGNMAGQNFGRLEDEVRAIAAEGLDIIHQAGY